MPGSARPGHCSLIPVMQGIAVHVKSSVVGGSFDELVPAVLTIFLRYLLFTCVAVNVVHFVSVVAI